MQLVLRLIFLAINIGINFVLLKSGEGVTLGSITIDNHTSIILFNAGMLLFVYIVDFIIVKTQRYRTVVAIGENLTHEHK